MQELQILQALCERRRHVRSLQEARNDEKLHLSNKLSSRRMSEMSRDGGYQGLIVMQEVLSRLGESEKPLEEQEYWTLQLLDLSVCLPQ